MDHLIQNNFELNLEKENTLQLTEEPALPSGPVIIDTFTAPVTEVTEVAIAEDAIVESFPKVEDELRPRTCYVYDQRMLQHWPPFVPDDEDNHHPERPRRISTIHTLLRESLCLKRMQRIAARSVDKFEAMLVHSEDHWEKVEAIELMDDEAILASEEYYEHLSLYVHQDTPRVAKLSAGGVIELCLAVARGEYKNGFAIVRPPGHHAEPEEHMGFCFFNNVAIAARVVQQRTNLKRILILDWDVHHGNGTQRAFWTDDSVLYVSIHRYEMGTYYPCGTFGSLDSCGGGKGLGTSVNIPWPSCGMGDADYLYAFEKIVLPIAYEFAPEFVIISAGFDAAEGDDLGECHVTPAGYAHMTHMLCSLAGGKVAVALEGGYNLEASAKSALAVTRVLLGEAPPELPSMVASEEATETIWQVATEQSKYWKCMNPKAVEPREESQGHTISIPELLNSYRLYHLSSSYEMFQIPLVSETLETRFSGQILCTKNVYTCTQTLVVLVHDLCNLRVELDGKAYCDVQKERSYLEDTTTLLIDWLKSNDDYAYIDVNLNARPAAGMLLSEVERLSINSEVVTYIWDNYVELSEAKHVVFICHGPGCRGMMDLLKNREVENKVRGIIHIVATGLPPRAPQNDTQSWYRKNSLVFVPSNNTRILSDTGKVRKSYGSVYKLPHDTSSRLFAAAFPKIKEFVIERILSTLAPRSSTTLTNGPNGSSNLYH